jgi:hypothetical protein
MTPLQMIKAARACRAVFGVANAPGDVTINITKAEAERLVRAHGIAPLDADQEDRVGWCGLNTEGTVFTIGFDT